MKEEFPKPEKFLGKYEVDEDGYVSFGDIAGGELGLQSQYASRYITGIDRPKLGEGLRILGDPEDYHSIKIHKDDIKEFVDRVNNHRDSNK